jgi:hypothetical protein
MGLAVLCFEGGSPNRSSSFPTRHHDWIGSDTFLEGFKMVRVRALVFSASIGGVAVGRGFEPQSDLELSFAKILIVICIGLIIIYPFKI